MILFPQKIFPFKIMLYLRKVCRLFHRCDMSFAADTAIRGWRGFVDFDPRRGCYLTGV